MKKIISVVMLGLFLGACSTNTNMSGSHPAYLHALSDLRDAKWMLENRPGNAAVSDDEGMAIQQIGAAIGDVRKASVDDGKDVYRQPGADFANDRPGRLHKALELLNKVRSDVAVEEDDPAAKDLQYSALRHIDAALEATRHALSDAGQRE